MAEKHRFFVTGALLLDGNGSPPLESPVIVVEGDRVAEVFSGRVPEGADGDIGRAHV